MTSRTVKYTLITSIALNALLGGIVLGRISVDMIPPPPPPPEMMAQQAMKKPESPWKLELDKFAQTLEPTKATMLQERFAKAREHADADKEKVDAMRKASLKELRTEKFNPKTYMEQCQTIANARNKSMSHFTKATIDVAEKLTHQERNRMADAFEKAMDAKRPPHPPQ